MSFFKRYFSILLSSLFWMRFTYLRKYTGYSFDKNKNLLIDYTFRYKRAPASISAKELLSNRNLLATFSSPDAFKIGALLTKQNKLDPNGVTEIVRIDSNIFILSYVILSIMFVMSLILSNLFAKRIIDIFGYIFPGGILIFPLTFAILDIVTECYGLKFSRKLIYINIAMQLIFAGISTSFIMINPANVALHYNESYQIVFGTTFRIVFAMVVASLVADLTNCYLFSFLKNRFHSTPMLGSLGIRCIVSTSIAEILFSFVWVFIFFTGNLAFNKMLHLIIDQYAIKVLYEILALPITYFVVWYIKNKNKNFNSKGKAHAS